MKNLLLLLLLIVFQTSCGKSQSILGVSSYNYAQPYSTDSTIGSLISESFTNATLSGWTVYGPASYTVNNGIRIQGISTAKDVSQLLVNTGYGPSTLRNYDVKAGFKINNSSGVHSGISVGVESQVNNIGPQVASAYAIVNFKEDNLQIIGSSSDKSIYTVAASASGLPDININDDYEMSFSMYEDTATASFTNATTGQQKILKYRYPCTTPYAEGMHRPNCFRYSVGVVGMADITFSSFLASSHELSRPDIIFVGNSETTGYFSTSFLNAFGYKLRAYTQKTIQIMAGGGNKTSDAIDNRFEIARLKPKYIFLMLGTNDGLTSQAAINIGTLKTFFESNGATVYVLPTPDGGDPNGETFNHILKTSYPLSFVDTWSGTNGMGSFTVPADKVDGVHFTNQGEIKKANKIHSLLPQIFEL